MYSRQDIINAVIGPVAVASFTLGTASTAGQPTYSIDAQGPTANAPGGVTEGDILTPIPPGVLPPPAVVVPAPALGISPGVRQRVELDALSYGREPRLDHLAFPQLNPDDPVAFNDNPLPLRWLFSVDEFAVGQPGIPPVSVTSEGAFGATEASADVFSSVTPTPLFPPAIGINTQVADGNGSSAPGLNLVEPNAPSPLQIPDEGDNLDALDWDVQYTPLPDLIPGQALPAPVYFSLDAAFTDPIEGPPINTATAAGNGVDPGDVLVSTVAGSFSVFADSRLLGLNGGDVNNDDLLGQDDLDALVLAENGNGVYEPGAIFEDVNGNGYGATWLFGETDMLLYSVRRGSAIIGTPDPIFGLPIEEGDILVPFITAAGTFTPAIFVPAENLGLTTVRSGTAGVWPVYQGPEQAFGDELDALDLQIVPEPAGIALLAAGATLVTRRRRV